MNNDIIMLPVDILYWIGIVAVLKYVYLLMRIKPLNQSNIFSLQEIRTPIGYYNSCLQK